MLGLKTRPDHCAKMQSALQKIATEKAPSTPFKQPPEKAPSTPFKQPPEKKMELRQATLTSSNQGHTRHKRKRRIKNLPFKKADTALYNAVNARPNFVSRVSREILDSVVTR